MTGALIQGIPFCFLTRIFTVCLLVAGCNTSIAATSSPNICIILVDDMGYGDPGCFNPESKIETPNIDSIAAGGMRFTDAHAPGPLCHMSRYGLLTGQYPFRTDVSRWPTQPLIQPDQMTIASLAKQSGYRTAMVGKWHLGFNERGYDKPLAGGPIDCGFDSFFGIRASTDIPPYFYIRGDRAVAPPSNQISANNSEGWSPIQGAFWRAGGIAPDLNLSNVLPRFTDEAISVIHNHRTNNSANEPLLLYLAYPAPHTPWLPSRRFKNASEAGLYGDFAMMVDAEIGRVLQALDRSNMSRDTLLIFTSDNGPCWREQDVERFSHSSTASFRGMKGDAWEGGHRMPMIVRWPGRIEENSTSDRLVCFTDFLATFAEILGVELSHETDLDSISFLSALGADATGKRVSRTELVMQAGSQPSMMAIRSGTWKLITELGSGGFTKPRKIEPVEGGPQGQLYNLATDPGETNNLYLRHPHLVAELTNMLNETLRSGDEGKSNNVTGNTTVDRTTLKGKVMCGYQGWFNTPGDGMGLGWKHWAKDQSQEFAPGNVTVDLWPDVSEFDQDELYPTGFKRADGGPAQVFSSTNAKTIHRHFQWMQQYGIDGVFLQRFTNGLSHEKLLDNKNKVLEGVRDAAARAGRAYALMYDLSGTPGDQFSEVVSDWSLLSQEKRITQDEAYLQHNGKPLVAVWGIGFSGRNNPRGYSLADCRDLILRLKAQDCSIMLGVPTGWRTLDRDSVADRALHEVLNLADVVSPWTPGRYQSPEEVTQHAKRCWGPDIRWCKKHQLDYMPAVFPGFSWHNMKGTKLGQIPRLKGKFLWSQFEAATRVTAEMIYVAMFDEVDEGTAIFKCTDNPPTGRGFKFLDHEGMPSDHYLKLTGEGGRLLRGETKEEIFSHGEISR